jgi:transposase
MVAKSWSRDRDKVLVERKKSKIHKIMHCKTSVRGAQRPRITTWNRDVNASRNILMLLMREIEGLERPSQFKPTQLPERPARVKVSSGSNTRGAVAYGLSKGSS